MMLLQVNLMHGFLGLQKLLGLLSLLFKYLFVKKIICLFPFRITILALVIYTANTAGFFDKNLRCTLLLC